MLNLQTYAYQGFLGQLILQHRFLKSFMYTALKAVDVNVGVILGVHGRPEPHSVPLCENLLSYPTGSYIIPCLITGSGIALSRPLSYRCRGALPNDVALDYVTRQPMLPR